MLSVSSAVPVPTVRWCVVWVAPGTSVRHHDAPPAPPLPLPRVDLTWLDNQSRSIEMIMKKILICYKNEKMLGNVRQCVGVRVATTERGF